ncbi:metalloproteinase inhibitor 4-like [Carassius carassius]|uniref:metalloproteinase inhibitor 4-like n=1 Tax=Carassius carassius TaxID=217509 RepID=UPI002868F8AA|nr:metalloproteinase inhibitor 4-like [Carassius carassius]
MSAVTLALLFFFSVALKEVQACSCAPGHPQELFCMSDIVMQAKVTGEKIIHNNENLPGMGKIVYEIQVIEVFKGFDKINEIQHVYTNEMSSICGVRLAFGQYLLSGSILAEGFFISMCDYLELWDKLSLMQKENLKYRYLKGCNCTIFTCIEKPCQPSTKNQCVLTDWTSLWPYEDGISVHQSACIRHSNGSCGWYNGTGQPSENDTIDMSEV